MRQIGSFNKFELATSAAGDPLTLLRSFDEVVILAFDREFSRLVELHFPSEAFTVEAALPPLVVEDQAQDSVSESAPQLGSSLPDFPLLALERRKGSDPILDEGIEQGAPYYATAFKDGELLEDYVSRRGGLIAPTTFSLVLRLLDELLILEAEYGGTSRIRLERILVVLEDESILKLRILEHGRWMPKETRAGDSFFIADPDSSSIVAEVSLVLFRLLTGAVRPTAHLDRVPLLNTLPGRLRTTLKNCLGASPSREATACSLTELRAQVQEALLSQSRDLHGKDSRRHLVALENMVPHSTLRHQLFPEPQNMEVLARRFQLEDVGGERHPFSLPVVESGSSRKLTVQLLPPQGCLVGVTPAAVPVQVSAIDATLHPNLLRCVGAWETPGLSFLLEDRAQELPLTQVLRERGSLKPVEVRLLLAQVRSAFEQATACGFAEVDIRPGNILLRVQGRITDREVEKLVHRRLDAWPAFTVITRVHQSLSSLMEPPVLAPQAGLDATLAAARSFAALAVTLLCGRRTLPAECVLPESFSLELASLVQSLHQSLAVGPLDSLPEPAALLSTLETLIPLAMRDDDELEVKSDRQVGLRSLRERLQALPNDEPLESVGSVSDFDEDQPWEDSRTGSLLAAAEGRQPKGRGGEGDRQIDPLSGLMKPLVNTARKSFLRGLWSFTFLMSFQQLMD